MLIKNGSTDVSLYFVLRDSTNHAPKTDITITDIDIYYVEERAAISSKIDLTALASADASHTDGAGYHVGKGLYRIDWPDAAFDGGIGKKVYLIVECTDVDTTFLEVELSPPVDAVAISGDATAADNLESACDGTGYNVGGGSIVAASVSSGVTVSTNNDKTGYALTSAYDAAKSAVDAAGVRTAIGLASANLDTQLSSISGKIDTVDDYVDTEVAAIKTVTDKLDTAMEADGGVYRFTANALEQAPSGGGGLTLDDIADAVWDEALSGHTTSGSAGAALSAAGSPGDPWSTLLPGSYGSGTAGKILGDRLDAAVSSRSTHSAADVWSVGTRALTDKAGFSLTSAYDAAKTAAQAGDAMTLTAAYDAAKTAATQSSVDAVKAKTDNLPSDPADQSAVEAAITAAHATTDAALATIDSVVDAILEDTAEIGVAGAGLTVAGGTGSHLTAVPWNSSWDAEVQSEVDDALGAAISEPADLAATKSVKNFLWWVYSRFYHKNTQTAAQQKTYKADGTTVLATRATSDDGTTQTLGAGS